MTDNNKGVTRRTVVKSAAWTVPVITVAATVPIAAASIPCTPVVTLLDGSFKCCGHGPKKGMHLVLNITLTGNCDTPDGPGVLVIRALRLGNNLGQDLTVDWTGGTDNGNGTRTLGQGVTIIANLRDVQSCPHYLSLEVSRDLGVTFEGVRFATDNIPGGDQHACHALTHG